jgi:DNA invertase Pin-like site-specific DNA recombinase
VSIVKARKNHKLLGIKEIEKYMTEAVALCRVSTLRQQQDGNSLEAQEKYIYECADKLEATIVRVWSLNASSRKGKNIARKDLKEILEFCKHHKRVRYFILDEPDRFMRSVKEYYWWQVEFERIGVRLAYAKMPELVDQDDPITVMREMFEVFKGEASNHERITKTNDKMRARIAAGYYPFYPHQ